MQTETLFLIGLAGLVALFIAGYQYLFKSKLGSGLKYSLFISRVLTLFTIGLLLVNPKFQSSSTYTVKPNLVLAVDNSQSIDYLNAVGNVAEVLEAIESNDKLNNRFSITQYSFGEGLTSNDSLLFNKNVTNISKSLETLGDIYKGENSPILLITDGNQTLGLDYSFSYPKLKQPVYPIVLGDSSSYTDLKISQLNVNRYAFLKNRFPVEVFINYNGSDPVESEFRITDKGKLLYKKTINLSQSKSSEVITTTLLADKVGIKSLKAEIVPLNNEKNIANNRKNFGVEVIDQKTSIAIVSNQIHPDLGALKKAIESNERRNVTIVKASDFSTDSEDYQLVILYQPNRSFVPVLQKVEELKLNVLYITGTTTDWSYLNEVQNDFRQAQTFQTEDYQAILNTNYSNFIVPELDFSNFPPLKSEFGDFGINRANEVLLYKTVNGISTNLPLLATYESNSLRYAVLNGEGIWKWRAHSYLNYQSFEPFDNFIGKLVQYLSSRKRRSRLQVDYKSFYDGNETVIISAQYFNKSYEFDANAALTLRLTSKINNGINREFPFLISNGTYKVNLSGLDAGKYYFKVQHNSEAISFSGAFEVLDYNVEQQFLNSDYSKLNSLAVSSEGQTFLPSQINELINTLLADSRYSIIQKSSKKIVPLININYLLVILALCLFFEWFMRKYHGLI